MSIEEKRRAAFEAWNLAEQQSKWDQLTKEYDLDVPMPDRFVEVGSEVNWRIWNAALDSVVIELPYLSRGEYANQHSFNCAAESMGYARQAIESAGLKVKP